MKGKESKWADKIHAYALKNAIEHEGKCQEGSIISSLFHEGLKKEDVKSVISSIKMIVSEINKLGIDAQKKQFEDLKEEVSERHEREGLPELENADNGVIMRFRPAPSGPLHIGHIISNMASSLYVKEYGGKFYIFIDDTNPEAVLKEAYENIREDCDWLFGNVHEYINASDRIEIYYDHAKKLIEKNAAYICTCDSEKFKKLIDKSKSCPCRKNSIKENLEKWGRMLDKKGFKEGEAVLRFKSQLDNPNPAMRDFPLARINEHEHPKQGKKYRVWPLMNLSVCVDDIEYGMTHIIRGKDHKDNAERQKMMYKIFGLEKKFPVVLFIGRVKFTDMTLSKRKLAAALKEGEFESASDVRLPTWISLRKRGYMPEAFAKMAVKRGISEVDKVMSSEDYLGELNNFNREILHEISIKASFEEQKKKGKGSLEVLMPDAKTSYGKSDLDLKKIKDSQIIHFIGLGYCKYNKDEKVKFWFAHK